jgi:hypothetical protein
MANFDDCIVSMSQSSLKDPAISVGATLATHQFLGVISRAKVTWTGIRDLCNLVFDGRMVAIGRTTYETLDWSMKPCNAHRVRPGYTALPFFKGFSTRNLYVV